MSTRTTKTRRSVSIGLALGLAAFMSGGCDSDNADEGGDEADGAKPAADAGGEGGGEAPAATVDVVKVAAGWNVACALVSDGTVRCWGQNDYGELGMEPSDIDAATPVAVAGITDAKDVFVGGNGGSGGDIGCVIHNDDSVSCWGASGTKPLEKGQKGVAEKVPSLAGATTISLGSGIGNASMKDGNLQSWGSNVFNALGFGVDNTERNIPVTKHPKVSGITAVATGQNHGCAIKKDGGVTCWGYSGKKQDPTDVAGVTGVTMIEAQKGSDTTCAVIDGGKVTCWDGRQEPKELEGLAGVTALDSQVQWCALAEGGKVFCWGANSKGQVGNGKAGSTEYKPVEVPGISGAVDIAAGGQFSCAALGAGGAKCWGWNSRGQLGDGSLQDRLAPTPVKHVGAATLPAMEDGLSDVQESDVEMSWEGLPDGCEKGAKLELKTEGVSATELTAVASYADSKMEGKTINVSVANYKLDPKNSWEKPRGEQLKFGLRFVKVDLEKEREPKPVDAGEYSMDTKQDRLVHAKLTNKAHDWTLASFSLEGVDAGTASITHLDENWVCGEANIKTGKDGFVKGKFAAKINKK